MRIIYSLHGYTSNYGENYVVSNANYLNQMSAGIEFNKKVKNNIFAKFEFGFDNSQLLKNTLGISLGVKFIIL